MTVNCNFIVVCYLANFSNTYFNITNCWQDRITISRKNYRTLWNEVYGMWYKEKKYFRFFWGEDQNFFHTTILLYLEHMCTLVSRVCAFMSIKSSRIFSEKANLHPVLFFEDKMNKNLEFTRYTQFISGKQKWKSSINCRKKDNYKNLVAFSIFSQ